VIVTLLRHIDRRKFKLALAVVDTRNAVFRPDVPDDVEFIDLRCKHVRYALPKIAALLWRMQPDVVFSTLGHIGTWRWVFSGFAPRAPRYIARETMAISQGMQSQRYPDLWRWMYRQFYKKHDLIVCSPKPCAAISRQFWPSSWTIGPHPKSGGCGENPAHGESHSDES